MQQELYLKDPPRAQEYKNSMDNTNLNEQNQSTSNEQQPNTGLPPFPTQEPSSQTPGMSFGQSPVTPPPTSPSSFELTPTSEQPVGDDGGKVGKKGLGMMIGALLVLIVVFLGIIFLFVMRQPGQPEQPQQQLPVAENEVSPTVSVSPTPELTEENLNAIDLGSPEAELQPIDSDLEQL